MINRWYLTPNQIAKMIPKAQERCWRCHGPKAEFFFHIWWSCVKVEKFCKGVNSQIRGITNVMVPVCARVMLILEN